MPLNGSLRRPAGFTEALEHEPRRLLAYADFFGKLDRGNALTCCNKQVHAINPLVEWDMGALHDGLGTNGKDFHAGIAAIVAALACTYALILLAMWALWAIRPSLLFHEGTGRFLIGKHLKQLIFANSRSAHDILHFVCRGSMP